MQYFPEPLARVGIAQIGTKRTCVSCAVRFYDLTRVPAACPKCGVEQPPPKARPAPIDRSAARRMGRAQPPRPFVTAEPAAEPEVEVEVEVEDAAEDEADVPDEVDDADDIAIEAPLSEL
jgi:uncharacterized protein (TIGR02300 family)